MSDTPLTDTKLAEVHKQKLPYFLHLRYCAEALQQLCWELERSNAELREEIERLNEKIDDYRLLIRQSEETK